MENISSEGKLAMEENRITIEDLYTFTEGDIKDLFTSFGDRRSVRKIIHLKQGAGSLDQVGLVLHKESVDLESDTTRSSEIHAQHTDLDTSEIASTSCSGSNSVNFMLTPVKYQVDEMLQKKALRSKSSPAQTYFNSLLKDTLKATKLWKNPITLQDITTRKKEEFHTIIENHVPALKSKRSEIWRRVGEHLQNRRKYLKDLKTGKRQKFLAQRKAEMSEKCRQNDSSLCSLEPGDVVKLKHNCDGTSDTVVGTGIFLNEENDMYSNIVLKSKDMNAKVDVDLPDGATTLKSASLKTMMLYWTKKLEKVKERKQKAKSNTCVSRKLDEMFDTITQSSGLTDADHLPSKPSKSKSANSKRPRNDGPTTERIQTIHGQPKASATYDGLHIDISDNEDVDLPVIEKKKRHKEKSVVSNNKSKCSKHEIPFRSFVLMEWANSKLFWGVKCVTETDFVVRNTVKSCGKLNTDDRMTTEECRIVADNTDKLRLSSTDVEVNPDMQYCVWEVPKENDLLKLDHKLGKFGGLWVINKEKFRNNLQEKLQNYDEQ